MTLHIFNDFEQGSASWHDVRRGIVTASVVSRLITPTLKVADNDTSRGLTNQLAAERITGWTDDTPMTNDMWRGVESEPIARDLYSRHHAPATEVGFMRRDEDGWTLGYSPDGLVGTDGLIEVKAPRAKGHIATVLAGRVPPFYMAQCQAGLLVSGRSWLDFVSYVGGLPLWVKRVHPDPDWFAAIEAACRRFEENARTITLTFEAAVVGLPQTERVLEEEMTL
jgi:putative phage-type endonuclease